MSRHLRTPPGWACQRGELLLGPVGAGCLGHCGGCPDSGEWGGPVTEAPGRAARTSDSLLRGPVSTALTLPSLPPKHPARIVGILRFLSGVQRRYAFNVSTMDTGKPSCLASRATNLPRVPLRASASEVVTPTCLTSEETAHLTGDSRRTQIAGVLGLEDARDREADEEAVRADQEVRTAPRVSIPGLSTLQPWFSRAKRVWSASVDRTSTVGPAPEMTAG